jgi:short-subunit dehydrogenase
MSDHARTVLVTGASSGIGAALARVFAEKGYGVVLTARRAARLEALAAELENRFRIRTMYLPEDLADPEAPARLFAATADRGVAVDILVNNAGFGIRGAYGATRWSDQAALMTVMTGAPTRLCHLYLPGMIERGWGRILNVASMMGLFPGSPGMTLYGAAKSYLVQMSETLSLETAGTGVAVTVSCPGYTESEFHSAAGLKDALDGAAPRALWMPADAVARGAFDALMAGAPRHVPGAANKIGAVLLGKLLPRRSVLALVHNMSRKLMEPRP